MKTGLAALCILSVSTMANAQGYAWYPSYYGGGYYRAPYYGGGLGPSCGYYGCYVQHRYAYQGYRQPVYHYRPPMQHYHYDWSWGGGNRAYLGGRGGGWGGEW